RRHTIFSRDWSSDVCSSDLVDDERLYAIVDVLDEIAKEAGRSIPEVAINWLLTRPSVSNVILGARNEEQLRVNLGATQFTLTERSEERRVGKEGRAWCMRHE